MNKVLVDLCDNSFGEVVDPRVKASKTFNTTLYNVMLHGNKIISKNYFCRGNNNKMIHYFYENENCMYELMINEFTRSFYLNENRGSEAIRFSGHFDKGIVYLYNWYRN